MSAACAWVQELQQQKNKIKSNIRRRQPLALLPVWGDRSGSTMAQQGDSMMWFGWLKDG